MSAFGRNADWLRNIEATPRPEVVIGSQHFVAAHRFLDEEEAMRVLTGYERRKLVHRTDHSRGVEPPSRLAVRRLNERSPAARRATTAYRVPYAASSDVITPAITKGVTI